MHCSSLWVFTHYEPVWTGSHAVEMSEGPCRISLAWPSSHWLSFLETWYYGLSLLDASTLVWLLCVGNIWGGWCRELSLLANSRNTGFVRSGVECKKPCFKHIPRQKKRNRRQKRRKKTAAVGRMRNLWNTTGNRVNWPHKYACENGLEHFWRDWIYCHPEGEGMTQHRHRRWWPE